MRSNSQPYSNTADPARGSSLQSIRTQQKAREDEEKNRQKRKKGVVAMMLQFLQEQGYLKSLDYLQQESQVSLQKVMPADNMDLLTIFSEFEDYYEFRFGRRPKYFRSVEASDVNMEGEVVEKRAVHRSSLPSPPPTTTGPSSAPKTVPPQTINNSSGARGAKSQFLPTELGGTGKVSRALDDSALSAVDLLCTTGTAIKLRKPSDSECDITQQQGTSNEDFYGRALKPFPRFPTAELNELAQSIHRDILDRNPNVSFHHIAELKLAKQLLKEAVVMPVKYPQLFQGIVRPWKGILLYGPPGTGKTMLAKAVATECRTTFFNISASSIVSKWRGDSEKLVRALFDLAVHYAPSTIFIDELDALMSARSSDGSEHEGSRRMKTELLIQMDGLSKRENGDVVFVLAASNVPWDLDGAVLRRLEKRILVGLPSVQARRQMFQDNLHSVETNFDFDAAAANTEGHSGADIDIICREATMRTVRLMIEKLENDKHLPSSQLSRPCVTTVDVSESIRCTRSSCLSVDLAKYAAWEKSFGSTMSIVTPPHLQD